MNPQQETFLQEYLRTGDKIKAYQTAYPNAKESSLKNSANRLLQNNPEIIAAVSAQRGAWKKEVEAEAKAEMKFEYLTQLRAKQLLTLTAEGLLETNKLWHTRNGFVTHAVTPSHAQILSAINKYAMMEGWYMGKSGGAKGECGKESEEEPYKLEIFMNKLPFEEYGRIYSATLEAYFDADGPRWRCEPDNHHFADRFLTLQKKREERRDEERAARMKPQLRLEEEQALREFQNRPVDETGYQHHAKPIELLLKDHSMHPEPEKLEALTALQKMCGLRFLHHRHRYEAEREAGWQFHPFNHALIRPVNSSCHSERSEESPRPMQAAQSKSIQSERQPNEAASSPAIKNQLQNRQQPSLIKAVILRAAKNLPGPCNQPNHQSHIKTHPIQKVIRA